MISATEALERLQEGNARFAAGLMSVNNLLSQTQRTKLARSQEPFAVILGCSDSRVPAEMVFDQGLGDLFVIRVAGNVVAPSQIGSVEFSAETHKTRLVVVMGHTNCGAIEATLSELRRPTESRSPNLKSIVDRIRPSVESLMETELRDKPDELLKKAVRANVRACVSHLSHGSQLLENLIANDGLKIVGAEYCLESGVVEFFDGTD